MATEIAKKFVPTVRASAVTADGKRHVLIEASGPGVTVLEKAYAKRNSKLWNEGKRPNRLGIWR